jgi:hypothetical protein
MAPMTAPTASGVLAVTALAMEREGPADIPE